MNEYEKQKGQDIFIQAIEIEANNRNLFIRKSCKDNVELQEYVLNLLAAHQSSDTYINELENSITSSHLNEIEDHLFRDMDFGNYQVINVLKQGGMGTIFLARRADGEFDREVVIKMIPIDLISHQSQVQFAHEKEILASLIHPNIVQLYDSGLTKNGQSYFVMELVRGKTIVNHCNDNKLNIKQRLTLFHDVLMAVSFAHQHLVIHGDIKPSNVMVNEDGQIKLLDFGIAKLIYKSDGKPEGYSLNYLTPEHKNKKPITTGTDIHQLGQLLFELLTGVNPKTARKENFEFPRLSTIAKNLEHKKIQSLISNMNTGKKYLYRSFNSDLQYIIEKALAIQPSKRYRAVQTFINDINYFSKGYCVSARSPTLFYQTSRYIKRNILLTAFIFSLILISAIFLLVTRQQNEYLAIERDNALKVKNLITDVFSAADPAFIPGKELSASEVLDIGLKRVQEKFDTHSDIEADLLQEIAQTYQNLGNYQKAQTILQQVYKIRMELHPNNEIIKAKTMLLLGENSRLMSNNKQAKKWLQQSLEIFKKDTKTNIKYIASVKSKLGRAMVLLGDLKNAENILNEATNLTGAIYGKQTFEFAQALNDLNLVYFRQGKYKQVQLLLLRTKQIRENMLADVKGPIIDKDYATNINNLGLAYYLQGELQQGEKYFRQAIKLRNHIFSKPHPDQAQSLTNLGLLLNDSGRPNEALPYLQEALRIRQLTLAKDHMRINDAWNNLALVYHENKGFNEAIKIYEKILSPVIKFRGESHPQTNSLYTNMANTYLELNSFQKAHNYFQKSLDNRLLSLPEKHLYLSYSYIGLGRAKIALGEMTKGKKHIEKGLLIRQEKLPQDHWLLGEAYYALAMVNYIEGHPSYELTNKACHILIETKGKDNTLTQKCLTLLDKVIDKKP